MRSRGYKPIADYAAIGNARSVALVGLDGSIDWCCLPELDDPSVFAAILDWRRGGRFRVSPAAPHGSEQRYIPDTNVVRTEWEADGGRLSVTDFMPVTGVMPAPPPDEPRSEILRLVTCETGRVEVTLEWSPRFDYARATTAMRRLGDDAVLATAPDDWRMVLTGLPVRGEIVEEEGGATLFARFEMRAGERLWLAARFGSDDTTLDHEWAARLHDATVDAWRTWVHTCEEPDGTCEFAGRWHPQVVRSGLALKLLTHLGTGAIAAAATTSLPETIGGMRNWDYRFSWVRDAAFTAQALFALGHHSEALGFLEWLEDVAERPAGSPLDLQILYGLRGERDLPERLLGHLEGYRGSRPVRIGNAAAKQCQLDIYGELMAAAYEFLRLGGSVDPARWRFLAAVADHACRVWRQPDEGIWEVRGGPRHYVYSKVMVWVALDRAIRMAERFGLPGRIAAWRRERAAVRRAVLDHGFDPKLGSFVQSFGSTSMDAANLLIPVVEFLPFDDPRIQGTIRCTRERLMHDGLVYRYLSDDGLPGGEGAFGLTTFWMVHALALSGEVEEAAELLTGMAARANHVGLYSEEIDPRTNEFLGNFPQAFTHIGLINAALYVSGAEGRPSHGPAPVGSAQHRLETGHRPS